jgi:DNA (cytosine-5)-methyltransferase 1
VTLRAVEFYAGIGAFAQAAGRANIDVVTAFDQSQWAKEVYGANYRHKTSQRNLDSIPASQIPDADLWWMSPPCTPFSRRGKQHDRADNRARSFLHLIDLIGEKKPQFILIENVQGFKGSDVQQILLDVLEAHGYVTAIFDLCPTMFGVPMLRPRIFIVASRGGAIKASGNLDKAKANDLQDYLFETGDHFDCSQEMLTRYAPVLNIVDAGVPGAYLICFTSGYHRCRQASGSLIKTGEGKARFVSPAEILGLLGFAEDFQIPGTISLEVAYKLVGNSVDVRAIDYLLKEVLRC